jgi:hypothetical protein
MIAQRDLINIIISLTIYISFNYLKKERKKKVVLQLSYMIYRIKQVRNGIVNSLIKFYKEKYVFIYIIINKRKEKKRKHKREIEENKKHPTVVKRWS